MLNPDKRYTVYRHTAPNGKQYVGITCRPPKWRWANGNGYSENTHFSNAIKKYGWDNFQHDIIATDLSMEEAVEMERKLIAEGDLTNSQNGYNHSPGGEVGFSGTQTSWTEERKQEYGKKAEERWSDYVFTKRALITKLRNKGIVIPRYLENTTLEDDWLDYDPLNPKYCGEGLCKHILSSKAQHFFRKHDKHIEENPPSPPCYGLLEDLNTLLTAPDEYDDQLFDSDEKVAVMERKEGCSIKHYDYVLCPDGKKRKIYSREDIEAVLSEWEEYCEQNWINGRNQVFDPEHKIKFMLDGLANILLRNHSDGVLTEYKKMKIGKYEIPMSVCATLFGDEVYSERTTSDNGESVSRMERILEDAAQKFDEARASKNSKKRKEELAKRKPKTFPPTRRQRIEKARKQYGVTDFDWVRVDTGNNFFWNGNFYHIPDDVVVYSPKPTRDGESLYDMDQILCGKTDDDSVMFFDMNIDPVTGVELVGTQTSFI